MVRKSLTSMLLALALALAACSADAPQVLAAGPDIALDPGQPGPYAVGVTSTTLSDPERMGFYGDPERVLRIEIWYPADESARGAPLDVIDLRDDAPPEFLALLGDTPLPTFEQQAVRDALPRTDQGLFPVVIFSHGNAAFRSQSFFLTTRLASHGYIVVAPDHEGNTLYDQPGLTDSLSDAVEHAVFRPQDVSFLIDSLEAGDLGGEVTPAPASLADLSRIGVSGHSFGGYTSLVLGSWVGAFEEPRITALAPISPAVTAVEMIGSDVGFIDAPTLYVGGTADATTPYDTELVYGYERQGPGPKGMVAIEDAGHLSFADFCSPELIDAAVVLDFPDGLIVGLQDGCGSNFADPAFVHDQTSYYITAWFNTYLRESEMTAIQYLDGAVPDPRVEVRLAR